MIDKTAEKNASQPCTDGMGHHLYASVVATLVLAVICCGIYPLLVWGIAQLPGLKWKAEGSLVRKDGTPTYKGDDAVGSLLLAQPFSSGKYFQERPSNAGNSDDPSHLSAYNAANSGGTNYGPTSARLLNGATKKDDKGNESVDYDGIHDRVVHYCQDNGIEFDSSMPIKQFQDAQGNLDDVKLIDAFNAGTPLVITPKSPVPADAVTASGSGLDPHISVMNARIQAARVAKARGIDVKKVQVYIDKCTDGPDLMGILGDAGVNVLKLNLALDNGSVK